MRRSQEFAVGLLAHEAGRQLTERTPDDALRYQSVMFALAKALDKVRAACSVTARCFACKWGGAAFILGSAVDGRDLNVSRGPASKFFLGIWAISSTVGKKISPRLL